MQSNLLHKHAARRELHRGRETRSQPFAGARPVGMAVVGRSASALILIVFTTACTREPVASPVTQAASNRAQRVVAQGQIMPAAGFIHLAATPGDAVEKLLVAVGDRVESGMTLATMRSAQLRQAQRSVLEQQRDEAIREHQQLIAAARRQVAAAKLKTESTQSQLAIADDNDNLVKAADEQVLAAKRVLEQMEAISNDRLTGEFLGRLEVDQQRLKVGELQLEQRKLRQSHRSVLSELHWALDAAKSELLAAEDHLASLADWDPNRLLDRQLAAYDVEDEAARIVAPRAGVVLAINSAEGESVLHQPLIEMADDSELVCEVEVNELDAPRVAVGQSAEIRSRAFARPLHGLVIRKYQLVGRPQLRPLDPLARADYRAITAVIELDQESTARAQDWLQLQVDVEIQVTGVVARESSAPAESRTPDSPVADSPIAGRRAAK